MRRVCDLLRRCCDEVASSLRRRGLVARTVTVKLRFADLSYKSMSHTMERAEDTTATLYPQSVELLCRMLGIEGGVAAMRSPGTPAARHPARRHERERIGEVGWFDRAADVG